MAYSSLSRREAGRVGDLPSFGLILKREAERAVEMVVGRTWKGRKIQANMAHYPSKGEMDGAGGKARWSKEGHDISYMEVLLGSDAKKESSIRRKDEREGQKPKTAGWIVDDGKEKGVRVASWWSENKRSHYFVA